MECASTGKTVITAEEGRKIELMYQSVMALPLGNGLLKAPDTLNHQFTGKILNRNFVSVPSGQNYP
ncbi:exonuclease VIII [Escherichia coli]|uniref:Exonuclease VIII n=1 Tax=Escherichia coli TaxID=562 RepID=A0A377E5U5_ECOLX|nr:exonuclease VIII [Escherichia coli]